MTLLPRIGERGDSAADKVVSTLNALADTDRFLLVRIRHLESGLAWTKLGLLVALVLLSIHLYRGLQ